jgi:Asp-tRNA(Asn)/Glu-tRNA(Gln) amidotransferase A subunit family amidase
MDNSNQYDLKSVKLPRLSGATFKAFTALIENPATRGLLMGQLLKNAGVADFRQVIVDEPPTFYPSYSVEGKYIETDAFAESKGINLLEWEKVYLSNPKQKGFHFRTSLDYAQAYRQGITTPVEVAQRVLAACQGDDKSIPEMHIFIAQYAEDILAQAHASTERIKAGNPLSMLDGVPVAVKDEVDQVPYPTTVGTRFLGKTPARQDSTVVARMRATGALLIGKANMHEIGIGVTGLNPHHGTVRNPYNVNHHTGGSSSGPAAAVAAGLCPIAIGADGGGSIRIPATFCGVVGLKATFGRVSEYGAAPLTWSMGHLGPIGATAADTALGYVVLAGSDEKDHNSLGHPQVNVDRLIESDLSDLVLGVYPSWFRHASPEVVKACEQMLKNLQTCGARVQEITIPGLDAARIAHLVTITGEMTTALDRYYQAHHTDFALETRLNLALARSFTARDYLSAQRVRTRLIACLEEAFQNVNIIVTPMTGVTAPPIRPDAQPDGESDLSLLTEIMRFATVGNLTGHPAISFPAGYDSQGLPIGFQAIGRPWSENVLLRVAYSASQFVERKAPQVYYDLLT